jgi:hypothetical protein
MNKLALIRHGGQALLAALPLGGCTTTYTWNTDKTGSVYTRTSHTSFDPEKAALVADGVTQALGTALVAYSNGVAEYEATHPTVYVQPQHGCGYIYVNGQAVFVQY